MEAPFLLMKSTVLFSISVMEKMAVCYLNNALLLRNELPFVEKLIVGHTDGKFAPNPRSTSVTLENRPNPVQMEYFIIDGQINKSY